MDINVCKHAGCDEESIRNSLRCKKHMQEMNIPLNTEETQTSVNEALFGETQQSVTLISSDVVMQIIQNSHLQVTMLNERISALTDIIARQSKQIDDIEQETARSRTHHS